LNEQNIIINPEYNETINEFYGYLLDRKQRDEATCKAYCYDVTVFANYYSENVDTNLSSFTVTPEFVIQYSDYLKQKVNKKTNKKLGRSTIKRRMIGLYAFWKYLYKVKKKGGAPVSLDDLEIVIRKTRNATVPVNSQTFLELRKVLKDELLSMFN